MSDHDQLYRVVRQAVADELDARDRRADEAHRERLRQQLVEQAAKLGIELDDWMGRPPEDELVNAMRRAPNPDQARFGGD